MEKKPFTPVLSLVLAVLSFVGFIGGGTLCLNLNHALKTQRQELNETRAQVATMKEALELQRVNLIETQKQSAYAGNQIAETQRKNQILTQQLTEMRSKVHPPNTVSVAPVAPLQARALGPDGPAPDSVEGQLRSAGKNWEQSGGPPVPGGYVQDTLEGRLDQPKGRGRIGIVLSVAQSERGPTAATVDFGHGYVIGIAAGELRPVRIVQADLR